MNFVGKYLHERKVFHDIFFSNEFYQTLKEEIPIRANLGKLKKRDPIPNYLMRPALPMNKRKID